MTTPKTETRSPERLHALDAVRGFALMAGVAYHATLSFVPTTHPIWVVEDQVIAALFLVRGLFLPFTFSDDGLFSDRRLFRPHERRTAGRRPLHPVTRMKRIALRRWFVPAGRFRCSARSWP